MSTDTRDLVGEARRNLEAAALILRRADQATRDAEAYHHASHGCDFEDSGVECPVCDTPDNIANETAAFFGGLAQADGAA